MPVFPSATASGGLTATDQQRLRDVTVGFAEYMKHHGKLTHSGHLDLAEFFASRAYRGPWANMIAIAVVGSNPATPKYKAAFDYVYEHGDEWLSAAGYHP